MVIGQTFLVSSNLPVGRSISTQVSNQNPDESITLLLTTINGKIGEECQVRIIVRDPTQPADSRPLLDVVVPEGSKKIKLEPVPQVFTIETTCLLGSAVGLSVVEFIEPSKSTGTHSDFQVISVTGATKTIDLRNGFNIDLALGASVTLTLQNPKNGERYLFWVTQGNNFDIVWPGNVIWSPALLPVTVGAGKIDIFTIFYKASIDTFAGSFNQDFA